MALSARQHLTPARATFQCGPWPPMEVSSVGPDHSGMSNSCDHHFPLLAGALPGHFPRRLFLRVRSATRADVNTHKSEKINETLKQYHCRCCDLFASWASVGSCRHFTPDLLSTNLNLLSPHASPLRESLRFSDQNHSLSPIFNVS